MFSLVLPAYNEVNFLEECVGEVKKILKGTSYEIIIAEDGSTDGTDKIAERLAKKDKKIRHLHSEEKLGRGQALKNAFSVAKGDVIGYIDVDLPIDPKHLKDLLKYSREYDVVTASRYVKSSKTSRPPLRQFVSKTYNLYIRTVLGCDVKDSQCGFKAFKRKFVEDVIDNITEKTWAWDTAVIIEACKNGYKIKEFPVQWIEKRRKRTPIVRLLKDIYRHGKVLLIWTFRYL